MISSYNAGHSAGDQDNRLEGMLLSPRRYTAKRWQQP